MLVTVSYQLAATLVSCRVCLLALTRVQYQVRHVLCPRMTLSCDEQCASDVLRSTVAIMVLHERGLGKVTGDNRGFIHWLKFTEAAHEPLVTAPQALGYPLCHLTSSLLVLSTPMLLLSLASAHSLSSLSLPH